MVYDELEEDDVVSLIHESSEDAFDYLFEKYKYIIDIVVKKYYPSAKKYGYGYNDLYQEALIYFLKALDSYLPNKDMQLVSFISLCVDRGINSWYRGIKGLNEVFYSNTLKFEQPYGKFGMTLMDYLSDKSCEDPCDILVKNEMYDEFFSAIENVLSEYEYSVYLVYIMDVYRFRIAEFFGKSVKQINNTIERIRKKLRKKLDLLV